MMDRGIFKIGNKAALHWECSDSLQLTSTYKKKNNPSYEINQMFVLCVRWEGKTIFCIISRGL